MVEQYPDATLASTNMTGSIADLRDNDATTFWSPTDPDTAWSTRFSMDDPTDPIDGTQTVTVLFDFFNGTDQTYAVELWDAGALVATLASGTAPGAGQQTVSATFDATAVSGGASVQIRTAITAVGSGMPGTRANARLGYVTWDATLVEPAPDPPAAPTDLAADFV